jgi:hypothetical protein
MDMNTQQEANGEKSSALTSQVKILESQIRDCFGRVVWSHKIQEKECDLVNERRKKYQNWQIILSAVSATGLITVIFGSHLLVSWFGNDWFFKVLVTIVSALQLGINIYLRSNDFTKASQQHSETASKLWEMKENYLSLLTDIKAQTIDIEGIMSKRDELQKNLSYIYSSAPRTTIEASKLATKGLKINNEHTLKDNEIDSFLPDSLRSNI